MDEGRVVRREGFLDARAVAAILRDPGKFDPDSLRTAVEAAFGPVKTLQAGLLTLGPGEGLEAVAQSGAAGGFLLDLDPPGWRSEWGGLLLFQDGERLHGYRPVPGALTLFAADTGPLISLLMLRAPPRVSLLGYWT